MSVSAPAPDLEGACTRIPFPDAGPVRPCVDEGFRWVEPKTLPMGLRKVRSFGDNEAWAVGNGVVLRWDGKLWSKMSAPVSPDGAVLWGSAPDDLWLSARHGVDRLLLQWNGREFPVLDPLKTWPGVGNAVIVQAIGGTRELMWINLYRSGGAPMSRILQRSCAGWRDVPAPDSAGFFDDLVVFAPDRAFATDVEVRYWDGARWSTVDTDGFERPRGEPEVTVLQLWSPDGMDLWGIGYDNADPLPGPATPAGVYRGSTMGLKPFRRWGGGSRPLAMEGKGLEVRVVGVLGQVERWDGGGWVSEPADTAEDLIAISDPWIVTAGGRLLRRNGREWRKAPGWAPEEPPVWRAGWAASPTDAWVVGRGAWHWDGVKWSAVAALAGVELTTVWGRSSREVWLAGRKVFRWDGRSIKEVVDPVLKPWGDEGIIGMWGPNQGLDLWLIDDQHLYRWDGRTARIETPPGDPGFYSIAGLGATEVWAVALHPGKRTVIRRGDSGWSEPPGWPGNYLAEGLVILGGNDVWVGGDNLLHWNGATWSKGPLRWFRPRLGFSASDVWGVGGFWTNGDPPDPWHYDGKEWHCVKNVPFAAAIFGSGPNDVWLAGVGGQLLHKGP